MTLAPFRTLATEAGLVVGLAGLGIDFWQAMSAMTAASSTIDALAGFWSDFTFLANLMVVLIYLDNLTGAGWLGWTRHPRTEALMAGCMALVMVFYQILPAPRFTCEGWLPVATILLHYVAPGLYLVWWLLFARHGGRHLVDTLLLPAPGLGDVAAIVARGPLTGIFPCEIAMRRGTAMPVWQPASGPSQRPWHYFRLVPHWPIAGWRHTSAEKADNRCRGNARVRL